MVGSPKSKRTAPARKFEDYILQYEVSDQAGLFPISNEKMKYVPGPAGLSSATGGLGGAFSTSTVTIGFNFKFDAIEYSEIAITACGCCVLCDPLKTAIETHVSDPLEGFYNNAALKDVFSYRHVVLAAWYDDLQNVHRDSKTIDAQDYITQANSNVDSIEYGKTSLPPIGYDPTLGGVKYYNCQTKFGNALVVRYKSFASYSGSELNVISFDIVLYENGTIEYRYAPRQFFKTDVTETATIGIFMHGGATNKPRYRDFSSVVGTYHTGYHGADTTDNRGIYKNGGSIYDGSYLDSSTYQPYPSKYTSTLNCQQNWPGLNLKGAIFRFLPPLNKRRVTKKDLSKKDGIQFFSDNSLFDDEKSIVYNSAVSSYPSVLPTDYIVKSRFANNSPRQNLFSSGSIEVNRQLIAGLHDDLLINESDDNIMKFDAFNEISLHEQGNLTDSFFATGSIIGDAGDFTQSLASKNRIKLSFPVKYKSRMLPNTSSLYYFNVSNQAWNIPTASLCDLAGPFDKTAMPTAQFDGFANGTIGTVFIEDKIGFDEYGNAIISGSLDIRRYSPDAGHPNQSSEDIGLDYSQNDQTRVMSVDYPKSIQRNDNYKASSAELFTLPIDAPFMLEKAVLEVPFCMGNGWFYDKTVAPFITCSATDAPVSFFDNGASAGNGTCVIYDSGGPAVTLSLMCQKQYGTGSVRDLIGKTTFTHDFDRQTFDVIPNISNLQQLAVLSSKGIPDAISSSYTFINAEIDGADRTYTGSIFLKFDATVSNGVCVHQVHESSDSDTTKPLSSKITNVTAINQNFMTARYAQYSFAQKILSIDTFGRGMTGFAPSGGSIFGKEYATTQNVVLKDGSVLNQICTQNTASLQAAYASLVSAYGVLPPTAPIFLYTQAKTFFGTTTPSPYLIYPGDKLILAASKTRPGINAVKLTVDGSDPNAVSKGIGNLLSSSYAVANPDKNGHDIQFNSGTIHITLYGSYVSHGREYRQ